MKVSNGSVLMAGVAVLTAGTLTFTQSVQPPPTPRPAPTVQLAADVNLTALTPLPPLITTLLDNPLKLLGPAAPVGALPPASAPLAIPIAPNLADTIDNIYLAIEPWVEYGFDVAESIVRWIPYVGWFAGQIGVLYEFGESIVASAVFNFTDFLRGDGGVIENLVDFGVDVGLAFVWLGLDEVAQFFPLPPFCCYPPRPPVQGPFLALDAPQAPAEAADLMVTTSADDATEENLSREAAATEDEAAAEQESTEDEDRSDETAARETEEITDETDEADEAHGANETFLSGTVEAQGEVRGPDVVAAPDTSTDGTAAQGADGADGVEGAEGVDGADADAADTDAAESDAGTE